MVKKVLFVCLGNICRSPIAEAVFLHLIDEKGVSEQWEVDSAALGGWHVGRDPDYRALETMEKYNLRYKNKARQITDKDFKTYDYIFGMDDDNIAKLNKLCDKANGTAKILLLGEFDPKGEKIIRDPFYDEETEGFEKCYQQCMRCCKIFLEKQTI